MLKTQLIASNLSLPLVPINSPHWFSFDGISLESYILPYIPNLLPSCPLLVQVTTNPPFFNPAIEDPH